MEKLISISELFEKSFNFLRERWHTIGGLALIYVASAIPAIVLQVRYSRASGMFPPLWVFFAGFALGLASLAIYCWIHIALLNSPKANVRVNALLQQAWPQLKSYVWIMLLAIGGIVIGFLFLVIPGIMLIVWWAFALNFFIFEGIKGTAALKQSRELVRGYWWPIFGRLLLMGLALWLVSILLHVFIGFFMQFNIVTSGSLAWLESFLVISSLADAALQIFMLAFSTIYGYLLYQDLKRIKATTVSVPA